MTDRAPRALRFALAPAVAVGAIFAGLLFVRWPWAAGLVALLGAWAAARTVPRRITDVPMLVVIFVSIVACFVALPIHDDWVILGIQLAGAVIGLRMSGRQVGEPLWQGFFEPWPEEGESRYKGTAPFQDLPIDRKTFFGRRRDTRTLLSLSLAERLVVLFGKSGLGKSSLINAGLVEPLRQRGFYPIVVRLSDPGKGPTASILDGVEHAARAGGVECTGPRDRSTLRSFFATAEFWSARNDPLRPILIVDQFEELFTLRSPEERERFIDQLAELAPPGGPSHGRSSVRYEARAQAEPHGGVGAVTGTVADLKIVLCLREDLLANLEELAGKIPGVLRHRFRLEPLDRTGAREAITGPAALEDEGFLSQPFTYSQQAVDGILDFLTRHRQDAQIVESEWVEPVHLQLICRHLEEVARRKSSFSFDLEVEITEDDLGGESNLKSVLQGFYDRTLAAIRSPLERARVRGLCEKRLISAGGRRLTEDGGEIERRQKVSMARLGKLVDARVLRAEPRLGGTFYEISHDQLLEPILESRRRRLVRTARRVGFVLGFGLLAYAAPDVVREVRLRAGTPETTAVAPPRGDFYVPAGHEPADRALAEYLSPEKVDVAVMSLEVLTRTLVDKRPDETYRAIVPPFFYLTAEMLGASMEVIATAVSRTTGTTTYRSYFVVRRDAIGVDEPSLDDLEAWVARRSAAGEPVTFLYHSRFSTASYFVPARFFRERGIFAAEPRFDGTVRIRSRLAENRGSTDLVRRVAEGDDLIAAVWDGTRAKFTPGGREAATYGDRVVFIPLGAEIPNDLLVVSPNLASLRQAIRDMPPGALDSYLPPGSRPDTGDRLAWIDPEEPILPDPLRGYTREQATRRALGSSARAALSELRRLSHEVQRQIVVELETEPVLEDHRLAAERSLAILGSRFVRFDPAYHHRRDVVLSLTLPEADGDVRLEVRFPGFDAVQRFRLRSKAAYEGDEVGLVRELAELMLFRMHRIAYLSPTWHSPTLLNDGLVSVSEGAILNGQKIRWIDPRINEYRPEDSFRVRVRASDRFKIELQPFEGFEPSMLSDVAYRVLLTQREDPSLLDRIGWP